MMAGEKLLKNETAPTANVILVKMLVLGFHGFQVWLYLLSGTRAFL